jgi:hypothetical protein
LPAEAELPYFDAVCLNDARLRPVARERIRHRRTKEIAMAGRIETRTGSTPRAPASGPNDAIVESFLDRMAHALTTGDTQTVASMWETPALVIGDEEVRAINSPEEIEKFFAGAKDQYNAQGVTDTRPDVGRLDWVTDRIVIVEVRWPYLDQRGNEVGEESSTYTLRRDGAGDLRLRVAVMHGAVSNH